MTLGLLCLYVLVSSVSDPATHREPEPSVVGIGIALAAVIIMPLLAVQKRAIARRIGSEAHRGDAAESITCASMAGTVLVGLALNAFLGWWWAEDLAALVFLGWLGRETWDAFEEARAGGE